jgi:hypothetical protein
VFLPLVFLGALFWELLGFGCFPCWDFDSSFDWKCCKALFGFIKGFYSSKKKKKHAEIARRILFQCLSQFF